MLLTWHCRSIPLIQACCLASPLLFPPQAESSSKVKTLEQQLAAARQQHDKAMKETEARHKREMEEATLRTAKVGLERLLVCNSQAV